SSSQPLHEPASTCRIASERPKRARISSASRTPSRSTSASRAGGSVTIPRCTARRSWRSIRSAPPRHALLALQLAEHVLRPLEMPAEDLPRGVEQLAHRGIAHGVAHGEAILARLDDVLGSQARQVLGDDRLVELQGLLQFLHAAAPVAEDLENAHANRVPEGLEELRLQRLQLEAAARLGHDISNIAISLYSQCRDLSATAPPPRRRPWCAPSSRRSRAARARMSGRGAPVRGLARGRAGDPGWRRRGPARRRAARGGPSRRRERPRACRRRCCQPRACPRRALAESPATAPRT